MYFLNVLYLSKLRYINNSFYKSALMKNLYKILLFLCISLILYNCTKEDEIPADVEVNDFIWKAMNAYYLYQDQIPDLADRRFNNQP